MTWREELAWAAGFFDGEGCASKATRGIRLSIGQKDKRTLLRFRTAVGGLGYVYGPYGPYRQGSFSACPMYQYHLARFEHVQAAVAMLWIFLSEPKRAQICGMMQAKEVVYA